MGEPQPIREIEMLFQRRTSTRCRDGKAEKDVEMLKRERRMCAIDKWHFANRCFMLHEFLTV